MLTQYYHSNRLVEAFPRVVAVAVAVGCVVPSE